LSARNGQTDNGKLWWQGTLPENADETVIELDDLFSFFRHPQRYFMRRQLNVRFYGMEIAAEEREPFSIAKLEGYAIYHEWIDDALKGKPLEAKKLQAQGRWLAGVPGEQAFERQQQRVNEFVDRIRAKNIGAPVEDLPIDLPIAPFRLVGKLSNLYEHGSLFYRYADLKGKDFMAALLHHLIINQLRPQPSAIAPYIVLPSASMQSTLLLSTDEDIVLLPEYCRAEYLSALLELYQLGQNRPDAFFVESALAYIKQAYKLKMSNRASMLPLDAAKEQLAKAVEQPYEPELRRLYGNVADRGLVLTEAFEQYCQALLQPIWEAMHIRKTSH
jgi:exodeoxyribonuclease V gamma subunit